VARSLIHLETRQQTTVRTVPRWRQSPQDSDVYGFGRDILSNAEPRCRRPSRIVSGIIRGSTRKPVGDRTPGGPLLDFHPWPHCAARTPKPGWKFAGSTRCR